MNSAAVRFQRQREADELLRYQTEEVTRRKLLNRRAAQEEAGLLRAAQAREERMDDASLEQSVEHKKERRAKLKALYKREWDGYVYYYNFVISDTSMNYYRSAYSFLDILS